MVATRKHAKGSPILPHTQRIGLNQSGAIAIGTGPAWTALVTLPEFVVEHSPVLLLATIRLDGSGGGLEVSYRVTRDGVALSSYENEFPNTGGVFTMTYHWLDESPGRDPVYVLEALAAIGGNESIEPTLLSAHF